MRWTFGQNLQEYRKILKPGFGRFWKEQFGRILGPQIAYPLTLWWFRTIWSLGQWFWSDFSMAFVTVSFHSLALEIRFWVYFRNDWRQNSPERLPKESTVGKEHEIGCHSDQITINRGIFRSEFVLIQTFCGELTKKIMLFSSESTQNKSLMGGCVWDIVFKHPESLPESAKTRLQRRLNNVM